MKSQGYHMQIKITNDIRISYLDFYAVAKY